MYKNVFTYNSYRLFLSVKFNIVYVLHRILRKLQLNEFIHFIKFIKFLNFFELGTQEVAIKTSVSQMRNPPLFYCTFFSEYFFVKMSIINNYNI